MPLHIGGPKARKVLYDNRDHTFACAFHYVNEEEAAIFYCPQKKGTDGRGFGGYVIALSSAWKYVDQQYLFAAACICAKTIGMDPYSRSDVHRVMDFIHSMLIELLNMEPIPDSLRPPTPQFEVSQEGNRIVLTSDRVH